MLLGASGGINRSLACRLLVLPTTTSGRSWIRMALSCFACTSGRLMSTPPSPARNGLNRAMACFYSSESMTLTKRRIAGAAWSQGSRRSPASMPIQAPGSLRCVTLMATTLWSVHSPRPNTKPASRRGLIQALSRLKTRFELLVILRRIDAGRQRLVHTHHRDAKSVRNRAQLFERFETLDGGYS
jgi:hypothetical protein